MSASYTGHPSQWYGPTSYSQHGEDIFVLNLFRLLDIPTPSYIDLGAHHPTELSTTALLYKKGSRGINIEANPHLMAALKRERPEDINVNVGVDVFDTMAPFYMFDDHSGRNTFSQAEAIGFAKESGRTIKETRPLPRQTLNAIVDEHCDGNFPHFLNCDIEGLDFRVLKGAEFHQPGKTCPVVICVETRMDGAQAMTQMLRAKSYKPHVRMGENVIYVHTPALHKLHTKMGLVG